MNADNVSILVADDDRSNRTLICRLLEKKQFTTRVVGNGVEALEALRNKAFDIILMDIMMPQMNGYQVLAKLKADVDLRNIPIIMISAVDEIDSVVKCVELGAEDYLVKPFNPVLLEARINACLEKKQFRDQEKAFLEKIKTEQAKSEKLLLNILPEPIAARLKRGEHTIADYFAEVTVMFADIVDFSRLASHLSPRKLVELLNKIFSMLDELVEQYKLEKIKTIGDAYMVVGGLPTPNPYHAEAIANMALDIIDLMPQFRDQDGNPLSMRIGICSGPVEAGVIGTRKFSYDLWGDTVNSASRMASIGQPNKIQTTESTYRLLHAKYIFNKRKQKIEVKGQGTMDTYFLMRPI